MANLAATGVEVLAEWYSSRDQMLVSKKLRLTLTGQGTTTNKILATVLGLQKVITCSPAVKSDNSLIIPAAPSIDGTMVLLRAAGSSAPADVTATVDLTITGEG